MELEYLKPNQVKGLNFMAFQYRPDTTDLAILRELKEYAKLEVNKEDIVLDLGAHIGAVSYLYASQVKRVIAVEPEEENFSILEKNLSKFSNVILLKKAVIGNYDLSRPLYVNKRKNKALHSLRKARGRSEVSVEAVNFDDLLYIYEPTVLKIDIEGGEWELHPRLRELPSTVRALAMELHWETELWRRACPFLLHHLKGQGFQTTTDFKGFPDRDFHRQKLGLWTR